MQMQAKQMGTQHTPKTTTLFFSVETRKENAMSIDQMAAVFEVLMGRCFDAILSML